jgi:2-dehydro-3-deoxyphosphogluconate aldolase/(4S)-4-hydroxy-2-oxoglutarate aldolase
MVKSSSFNVSLFWEMPLVAILRGFPLETIGPIVEAIGRGGLRALEITMNTPGAEDQIRRALEVAKGSGMQIGAGTVTTAQRLEKALKAGASFIVTPNLNPTVIQLCQDAEVPFIPGAFTPTEIYQAYEQGALAAKIFPADTLGPNFIKAIKAPLPNVKVAPTGGVTVGRMCELLEAGADALGVGSPLFPGGAVQTRDWVRVEKEAQAFSRAFNLFAGQEDTEK